MLNGLVVAENIAGAIVGEQSKSCGVHENVNFIYKVMFGVSASLRLTQQRK